MLTDAERQEMEELKDKCIDKRNGQPRKSAETSDLERLKELCERDTEPKAPPKKPLSAQEKDELADLERRARQGRTGLNPSPHEMLRLSELRARNKK